MTDPARLYTFDVPAEVLAQLAASIGRVVGPAGTKVPTADLIHLFRRHGIPVTHLPSGVVRRNDAIANAEESPASPEDALLGYVVTYERSDGMTELGSARMWATRHDAETAGADQPGPRGVASVHVEPPTGPDGALDAALDADSYGYAEEPDGGGAQ